MYIFAKVLFIIEYIYKDKILMSEIELSLLTQLFRVYSIGLCIGAASIAMVFYFYVVAKGNTAQSQNIMMHIVYTILHVGMVLIACSELTEMLYNNHMGNTGYWANNPELFIRLTIFGVILGNAYAMEYKGMDIWLGLIVAGGSWYAYFFLSTLGETNETYFTLLASYASWLMIFGLGIALLKTLLTHKQKTYLANEIYS